MDQPHTNYRRWPLAAVLAGFVALSAWAQQAPEKRPEEPQAAPLSAEQLFRDATTLLEQKQTGRAIDALQRGLMLAPKNPEARLLLADLLIQNGRPGEAAAVLHSANTGTDTAAIDERLLKALQASASPLQLAMTAEAVVARHPENAVLLNIAVEAMLGVDAHERAMAYWQKLSPTEQGRPTARWLLGRIHEAADRPAEAWAAYTLAAGEEPRAQSARQRLSERLVVLDGWRYFPPRDWALLLPGGDILVDRSSGIQARVALIRGSTPMQAAEASLAPRLPISRQQLARLLSQSSETPTELVQITFSNCLAGDAGRCIHAGPTKAFAGLLPEVQMATVQLGSDVLIVSIDNADRPAAFAALQALGRPERIYRGVAR